MKINWNLVEEGGRKTNKLSMGGVWIFPGSALCHKVLKPVCNFDLHKND